MSRGFFYYLLFLIIIIFIIISLFFGFSVKYYLSGGKKFKEFKEIIIFSADIPKSIFNMIRSRSFNPSKPPILTKHKNKKRFERFIEKKRNALLVLPRYDHSLSRSVVDIINLNNFEIIHSYQHDISEMNKKIKNKKLFPSIKINDSQIRFRYSDPIILEDGSLIASSVYGPMFKIDFCSKLKWINDEQIFHHSKMQDHEGNIWVGGVKSPQSKYVSLYNLKNFSDDSIIKINQNGKILMNKSVTEILIENKILPKNFALTSYLSKEPDPIHLNDIEPAFNDTDYYKKGDLFLSPRNLSSIIHYRPSTNKVINYITGPFVQQHDVDIISDKEISIFNNNNSLVDSKYSEIIIYDFESRQFKKKFNNQLKEANFKTINQGISQILDDGALMVNEQNHARIILFNNKGNKEWEFVNKDKNGNIGLISFNRIIEDKKFIDKFKLLINNKRCLN